MQRLRLSGPPGIISNEDIRAALKTSMQRSCRQCIFILFAGLDKRLGRDDIAWRVFKLSARMFEVGKGDDFWARNILVVSSTCQQVAAGRDSLWAIESDLVRHSNVGWAILEERREQVEPVDGNPVISVVV
ncbi:hypothetical protein FRC04_002657 [Tulasnella sp. 424]|nr:hypothetical protein FRC04_002657 [Tulasnella sp. 424]KAG8974167.1 hypothetical protein FRC05_007743 [Tulasnella sp. 425]